MKEIVRITPFLHVPDMARALDHLTRVLRFEIKFSMSGYTHLEWGGAALRVLEEPGLRPAPPDAARMSVYIDVRDVDALYRELLPSLATLPEGHVRAPIDQPWNQREFHVRLPDGHWLAYGHTIAPRHDPWPEDAARPADTLEDPDEDLED